MHFVQSQIIPQAFISKQNYLVLGKMQVKLFFYLTGIPFD